MPYKISKKPCTQSDGNKGSYVLSYTSKNGKKHNNCHTSKEKAHGQIASIESETIMNEEKVKFGKFEVEWYGNNLAIRKNAETLKIVDVGSTFTMNDFKKAVKKIAQMAKLENELPFSILADGVDSISDEEAAMDFDDLEDQDVDNDGDTDDSDEYLHHKLSVVAKKTEGYRSRHPHLNEGTISFKTNDYRSFDKKFDKWLELLAKNMDEEAIDILYDWSESIADDIDLALDKVIAMKKKAGSVKKPVKVGTISFKDNDAKSFTQQFDKWLEVLVKNMDEDSLDFLYDWGEYVEDAVDSTEDQLYINQKKAGTFKESTRRRGRKLSEAAPKMKGSNETTILRNLFTQVANAQKGGSANRYGKEFNKAKTKALRAIQDLINYSSIGA